MTAITLRVRQYRPRSPVVLGVGVAILAIALVTGYGVVLLALAIGIPVVCAVALRPPPIEQDRKTLVRWPDAPVKLRRHIVAPAIREPFARVRKKLAVSVQSRLRRRRDAGSPDSKRTDADADSRLSRLDRSIERADEVVDVVSTPIGSAQAAPGAIALPGSIIRKGGSTRFQRVRIKVIVEMYAIDIVTPDDVSNDADDIGARRRVARVEPELFAEAAHPFGMLFRNVIRRQSFTRAHRGAKRIDPGMQFEPARVRLSDRKLKGIVAGRHPRFPAQEF